MPIDRLMLIFAILLLIAAGFTVTFFATRRRRDVWRRFARRHGLRFVENEGRPVVAGMVEGRMVTLSVPRESSDSGELGIEEIRIDVGLEGRLPQGFELMEGGHVVGEARKAFGERVLATGDARFDDHLHVSGNDSSEVRAYLDENRRHILLGLLEDEGGWSVLMDERKVGMEKRSLIGRADELEDKLDRLLAAAPRLDAAAK